MTKADLFFKDIKNKRVVFIGLGVSHNDLIKLFIKKGIDVTVCDRKSADKLGKIYNELLELGVKFELGENYLDKIFGADIVFRAPGMYFNNPILQKAKEKGIVITSEMEVFFDLCPCKIYGITGTEGKTTTTSIISEMLERSGKTVHKGGNIGRALPPIIEEISEDDVAIVELSELSAYKHEAFA